ncbi:MAG: metallophosphoesterase family protein [Mycobacteriales bacterium]
MRVAVLADIHGHLPALEAVLAEIDAAGADAIVVNGDTATGPLPADTLDLLDSRGEQVVWVRGNADRELVAALDGTPDPELNEWIVRSTAYAASTLQRRHRDLLDGLPLSVTLDVDGLGPVRFCHATLRNDTDIVLVDSPVSSYAEGFAGAEEEVFVLGHTHMPFDRLADRRRFVNPGSVGMPYGGTGAYWALLGPEVTLRRTEYDLAAAADRLRAADGWPDLAEFVAENVLTVPSDAEALAVFSPRQLVARPR